MHELCQCRRCMQARRNDPVVHAAHRKAIDQDLVVAELHLIGACPEFKDRVRVVRLARHEEVPLPEHKEIGPHGHDDVVRPHRVFHNESVARPLLQEVQP